MTESFPLPTALTTPVQRLLDLTLDHLDYLHQQIQQVESWIAAEAQTQPGVVDLATIPGIGSVFACGIAAEMGNVQRFLEGTKWDKRRKRYRPKNLRDAKDAVAKLAGLWWPRTNSGDFEAEDRRLAKSGNRYLRYYLIEAADKMRQHIPEYADFYTRKYQEVTKHQHKRALVLTARIRRTPLARSVGLFVGLRHRHEAYRHPEG